MTFAKKIRNLRKKANLTQTDLGRLVGVGKSTVTNWENGYTYPKHRSQYEELAKIFGVSEEYLKNETNDEDIIEEVSGNPAPSASPEFEMRIKERYGSKAAIQARALAEQVSALFAGGELTDEDKDNVMLSIQMAYIDCKTKNIELYGKKNKGDNN